MQGDPITPPLREAITRLLRSIEESGQPVLVRHDRDLLQSIVEAAAHLFGAAAASIALVDDQREKLVFQVAYGVGAENVIGVSIPLDHGLAGYVVTTGQPIAVRDVLRDARFNQSFATSTGYIPRSILAAPLLVEGCTIGVMEVLDKIGAPSFGMQDIGLLRLFARQAALAIDLSLQLDHLDRAVVDGLRRLAIEAGSMEPEGVLVETGEPEPGAILPEADSLVGEISRMGPAEQRAFLGILRSFASYARSKSAQ